VIILVFQFKWQGFYDPVSWQANKVAKVSVIIPVYNTAPYLCCCLDSVCGQTLQDIEIICVNDVSPDNSQAILDDYAAKDSRIKNIIHDKNRGPSAARNTGMEIAAGDYIYFLDSDDWIDGDYLEKMTKALEKNHVEVVLNTCVLCFADSLNDTFFNKKKFYNKCAPGMYRERGLVNLIQCYSLACCYIYKREFLKRADLKFPEGLRHEDCYFSWAMLPNVKNLYVIDNSCYHYRKSEDSFMGYYNKTIDYYDMIEVIERIYEYYKTHCFVESYAIPFQVVNEYLERHAHQEEYFYRVKEVINKIKSEGFFRENFYDPDEVLLWSSETFESFMPLFRQMLKKRMSNMIRLVHYGLTKNR
jgi:glycosyltransferase involved in cell wall biosynthesis